MLPRTIDLILLLLLASNVQASSTFHTNCTLPPQHTSFVSAPNTRGTLQILWSSLFTILACTWTVLHLNVPEYVPKPEIKDFKKWLKWMVDKYQHPAKWFLLTVLAPEIPFAKYWDDQVRGHSLFYHYETVFRKKNWTRTHVLFANMGGFALRCTPDLEESSPGSKNEKATTEDQDDYQTSTSPPVEDDTSLMGGPSTLKPMTSASCCGKPEKQIPSTLIGDPAKKFEEVFYLTAIEALKLLCSTETSIPGLENVSEEEINARSKSDMFMRLLAVGQIVWVVIQIISRWAYGLAVTQLEVTVVAFAFCAVGMYTVNHGKPKGVELPILFEYPGSTKVLTAEMILTNPSDTFTAIVQMVRATLKSSRDSGDPIGNGFVDESEDPSKLSNISTDLWMFIGSMIFGGIHLIAWDFQFPTTVEKYLWWAASLWCTACTIKLADIALVVLCLSYGFVALVLSVLLMALGFVGILAYIVARLFIVVEMFRTLVFLPPDAYIATWSSEIPNIG
ncbi:hypothetical protein BO79DRAFT_138209 [Aspergillus costaricaensis CBS 115574]|uniref:Uncharacterized protein n=1 Tax=Aspergillus costaricaensis CBS 115574 TaxID=1448317 RepID=A0ACD1IQ25_9EURO|nr:hypothetical protein BO79DRAFT_138209 [Aspergillus costaricaensis CBS 115574]RAK92522.1 hypothetical protein BO79DRAFT_138209 [Aspergillus costaricaensis CBS 115574]